MINASFKAPQISLPVHVGVYVLTWLTKGVNHVGVLNSRIYFILTKGILMLLWFILFDWTLRTWTEKMWERLHSLVKWRWHFVGASSYTILKGTKTATGFPEFNIKKRPAVRRDVLSLFHLQQRVILQESCLLAFWRIVLVNQSNRAVLIASLWRNLYETSLMHCWVYHATYCTWNFLWLHYSPLPSSLWYHPDDQVKKIF